MRQGSTKREFFIQEGFLPDDYDDSHVPLVPQRRPSFDPPSITSEKSSVEGNIHDVFCSKTDNDNHPGNRVFRRLINSNKELFKECNLTSHKLLLVSSIVKAIQNQGGRFLKKDGDNWVEISHKDASIKTALALKKASEETSISPVASHDTALSKSKAMIRRRNKRKKVSEFKEIL